MRTHDLLGVGLGPFGLSLAALADGTDLDAVFLEQRPDPVWHGGLLLEGATLQVPFLADLVSLVDPTNPWSFLAYLKAHGRLFRFYLAERFQVPRAEYDDYLRWVARTLPSCRLGTRVDALCWDDDAFLVRTTYTASGRTEQHRARAVVLSVGTEPVTPPAFAGLVGGQVHHAADYLSVRPRLHEARSVTVIGSGQSGAEVLLDLLRTQPETGTSLRWLTRSRAFAPMEYSKLGLEHFTPDYTAYFRDLPEQRRDALVREQWQLYKGISAQTIADVYDLLYERSVGGRRPDVVLAPGMAVESARLDGGQVVLGCRHAPQDATTELRTDAVVLATGYAARQPALLEPLRDELDLDEQGRYRVDAHHRVALRVPGALHVQNAESHTHGVGTPDLGLGAWRSATILGALTGQSLTGEQQGAFTTFGVA